MPRVSAIVICLNEERKIGRCLASLAWVDELVVVDGGSTDRTVPIARTHGATVHTNPWPGFAAQKTFALAQATGDWVVSLDADEELEPRLVQEIQTALASCPPDVDGLVMPRKTRYLGRWITHGEWYPDDKLRVFRRDRGACTGDEVHERFTVPGRTIRLSGHILHYSHDDIAHHVRKVDQYAGLVAATRRRAGARSSLGPAPLGSDPARRPRVRLAARVSGRHAGADHLRPDRPLRLPHPRQAVRARALAGRVHPAGAARVVSSGRATPIAGRRGA